MKKVLNFIKRVGADSRVRNFMILGVMSIFPPTNGLPSIFLFGEIPFPEEAYIELKKQIKCN